MEHVEVTEPIICLPRSRGQPSQALGTTPALKSCHTIGSRSRARKLIIHILSLGRARPQANPKSAEKQFFNSLHSEPDISGSYRRGVRPFSVPESGMRQAITRAARRVESIRRCSCHAGSWRQCVRAFSPCTSLRRNPARETLSLFHKAHRRCVLADAPC